MEISFAKLNHLVTIARTGNVSRAAEQLNISQPALSRSIASIEERYGISIFDRSRTGATPTAAGHLIVVEAERLLRNARTFDHNLKLYGRGEAGQLLIGLSGPIAGLLLSDLGKQILCKRPGMKMRTLIRPPFALCEALINEEIELFVCSNYGIASSDEVDLQNIGGISSDFIVRSSHPLRLKPSVSLHDLTEFPIGTPVDPEWPAINGVTAGTFICDDFHIMRNLTIESDMVWICPISFVVDDLHAGTLSVLRVQDSPLGVSEIVVGTHRGRSIAPLAQEAIEFCSVHLA